jgi:hypothetical protein
MNDGMIVKPGQLRLTTMGTEEPKEDDEPPVELLVGSIRWREVPIEEFEIDEKLDHQVLELGTLKRNNNISDSLALLNQFSPTGTSTSSTTSIKDSDHVEKVDSGRRKSRYKKTEKTDENQVQKVRKHKSRAFKDSNSKLSSEKKKSGAGQDRESEASDFSNIDFEQLTNSLNASAPTSANKAKEI